MRGQFLEMFSAIHSMESSIIALPAQKITISEAFTDPFLGGLNIETRDFEYP